MRKSAAVRDSHSLPLRKSVTENLAAGRPFNRPRGGAALFVLFKGCGF